MSFSTDHEQYRDREEEAFNERLLHEDGDDEPELRCLQDGPDCQGPVEYRLAPDRDDLKAFPRCEFHWQKRLASAERSRELLSDVPPSWFDPSYAGESWDED